MPNTMYIKVVRGVLNGCKGYVYEPRISKAVCKVWKDDRLVTVTLKHDEYDFVYPPKELEVVQG